MLLRDLCEQLGGRLIGDGDIEVHRVRTLSDAAEGDLGFLTNAKYQAQAYATHASCILVDEGFAAEHAHELPCAVIALENPYLALAQALGLLHPRPDYGDGVSPDAWVSDDAILGDGVRVMPMAYVGRASLGDGCLVMPGAFIDDDVRLGANVRVGPGCVLMHGTVLGDNVFLNPGVVLGGDGFGFAPDGAQNIKVPQVGGVRVAADVELGANTCVDRGAVSDTEVGAGTKVDNLVQIAHGAKVGENVVLVAQVGIAGSTEIGDGAVLAGQVGVVGHIKVGKNARIGAKSGVTRSIPDQAAVSGYPALPHATFLKSSAHIRRLDGYVRRIKQAENTISELTARLEALEAARQTGGAS